MRRLNIVRFCENGLLIEIEHEMRVVGRMVSINTDAIATALYRLAGGAFSKN